MARTLTSTLYKYLWAEGRAVRLLIDIPYLAKFMCYGSSKTEQNVVSGSDGIAFGTTTRFVSASGNFVTNGIHAGDKLVITSGTPTGTFTITAIPYEDELTLSTSFPGGVTYTSLSYRIDRVYQDILPKDAIPQFGYSVDRMGGLKTVNDLSLTILNQDGFSDVFGTKPLFANRPVTGYLLFPTGSTFETSEKILLFTGIIGSINSITRETVVLDIQSDDLIVNHKVGDLLASGDYSAYVSETGEVNLDEVKQTIYGNNNLSLYQGGASTTSRLKMNFFDPEKKYPECLYLGRNKAGDGNLWLVNKTATEYATNDSTETIDIFYKYDSTRLCKVVEDAGTEHTALDNNLLDGKVIETEDTFGVLLRMHVDLTTTDPVAIITQDTNTIINDLDNLEDTDLTNYTTLSIVNAAINTSEIEISFAFPVINIPASNPTCYVYISKEDFGNTGDYTMEVKNGSGGTTVGVTMGDYLENYIRVTIPGGAVSSSVVDLRFILTKTVAAGVDSWMYTHLYDVFLEYEFDVPHDDPAGNPLLFGGNGAIIGSYLADRSTSDADPNTGDNYTETHADEIEEIESGTDGVTQSGADTTRFTSAGAAFPAIDPAYHFLVLTAGNVQLTLDTYVIKSFDSGTQLTIDGIFPEAETGVTYSVYSTKAASNVATFIEVFTRNQLSFGDSNLALDSFNVASNDLSTTQVYYNNDKTEDADRVLNEVAKSAKSVLYFNEFNRLTLKTLMYDNQWDLLAKNFPSAGLFSQGRSFIHTFDYDPPKAFTIDTNHNSLDMLEDGTDLLQLDMSAYNGIKYEASAFASLIAAELSSASPNGRTYVVGYSTGTNKFTIAISAGTVDFSFASGTSDNLCEMLGFISSSFKNTGAGSYSSDFEIMPNQFMGHPIVPDSFQMTQLNTIQNKIVVTTENDEDFTYEDSDSQAFFGTQELKIKHKYTTNEATAAVYGNHILARNRAPIYQCSFTVLGISPMIFSPWDFCSVVHPEVTAIFTAGELLEKKWIILSVTLNNDRVTSSVVVEELLPTQVTAAWATFDNDQLTFDGDIYNMDNSQTPVLAETFDNETRVFDETIITMDWNK